MFCILISICVILVDADVVAEVLALHEDLPSLDLVPSTGAPQEPNIDLSTVFNDFFPGKFSREIL